MVEIERKFLVTSYSFKDKAFAKNHIAQGYLSSIPERSVRVRIKNNKGFLTIKGITEANKLTRYEWEKEIPLNEAQELLLLCEDGIIDKIRYEVDFKNHIFEIDVFNSENEGLIIAEIELQSEDEFFERPDWLGEEVTFDTKYYNSYLSKHPFSKWEDLLG